MSKIPVSFWKEAMNYITQTRFGTVFFYYNLGVVVKTERDGRGKKDALV